MEIKNVKCFLVKKVSKKTGNEYIALELTFENGYKKLVLINDQEKFILGIN